jgi:hypothetical protein
VDHSYPELSVASPHRTDASSGIQPPIDAAYRFKGTAASARPVKAGMRAGGHVRTTHGQSCHCDTSAMVGGSQVSPLLHPVAPPGLGTGRRDGMSNQGCRSKDPVVRLEPFFAKAPVAPHGRPVGDRPADHLPRLQRGFHAAFARFFAAAEAAVSNWTETRFDTPDSSIVTP